jgi:hypothetical protein
VALSTACTDYGFVQDLAATGTVSTNMDMKSLIRHSQLTGQQPMMKLIDPTGNTNCGSQLDHASTMDNSLWGGTCQFMCGHKHYVTIVTKRMFVS